RSPRPHPAGTEVGGLRLVRAGDQWQRSAAGPRRPEEDRHGEGQAECHRREDGQGLADPDHSDQGPQPSRQAADSRRGERSPGIAGRQLIGRGRKSTMKMGKSVREAFGIALAKIGEQYRDIVVLDGDVHNSTRTDFFAKKFPDRFFNVGIAESNLVSAASGLAASGKRAWLASFAAFVMCNAYDQLRIPVAFPNLDVKVVGSHARIR